MGKATIYFAQGKKDPMPREIDKLKPLVEGIEWEGTQVKLLGHASKEGSDRLNKTLSKDRAGSLEAYLIVMGAHPKQIQVKALGESKPAVKERGSGSALEKLRAKNRRVEVEYKLGKKPSGYQKLVDKTKDRFAKGVATLKARLQMAENGRKKTLAHPNKVPAVLQFWQELIDTTKDELNEWAGVLKGIKDAERKIGDPKKVWFDHIAKDSNYYDRMIEYQREHIKRTQVRLKEAQKALAAASDKQNQAFWKEMVLTYSEVLKRAIEELAWRKKDKQRASTK